MKLEGRQGSKNIDDRRGSRGGGRRRAGKTAGGVGIGAIIVAIIVMLMGGDPSEFLGAAGGGSAIQAPPPSEQTTGGIVEDDLRAQVVSVTLKETENLWNQVFPKLYGKPYREPVLVLFSNRTSSACGLANSGTGPFYCPADQKVYIDLSFADMLRRKFRAPGDFALAYVVAHEVGHHVQTQLGYSQRVSQARRTMPERDANQMSVRLELQADYLSGIWAHYADKYAGDLLEDGDIQEALAAASSVGDDNIQKMTRGYVEPETFTHGTSEQRVRYFTAGYRSGDASKKALDYFFQAREL